MTREEVKEDLQRMKKARVSSPTEGAGHRRSRRLLPEESGRLLGLPSSSTMTEGERTSVSEEVDEEVDAQGLPKKARISYINFLEGRSYIHPVRSSCKR